MRLAVLVVTGLWLHVHVAVGKCRCQHLSADTVLFVSCEEW
jgi:hypothetical protein